MSTNNKSISNETNIIKKEDEQKNKNKIENNKDNNKKQKLNKIKISKETIESDKKYFEEVIKKYEKKENIKEIKDLVNKKQNILRKVSLPKENIEKRIESKTPKKRQKAIGFQRKNQKEEQIKENTSNKLNENYYNSELKKLEYSYNKRIKKKIIEKKTLESYKIEEEIKIVKIKNKLNKPKKQVTVRELLKSENNK